MPDIATESENPRRKPRGQQTQQTLVRAAAELLTHRKSSDVTLQEVADHAGLHVQTLYRHFQTKESLVATVYAETFSRALKKRKTDTLTFWRQWVAEASRRTLNEDGGITFMRYLEDRLQNPHASLLIGQQHIRILTNALAEDFGLDARDLYPALVANMLWSANSHNVGRWQESAGEYDLEAGAIRAVDQVVNIVTVVKAARDLHGLTHPPS